MIPSPFRLRFALALLAIMTAYGLAGQRDYEDARRSECASARIPKAYDPETDRCVKLDQQPESLRHATPEVR